MSSTLAPTPPRARPSGHRLRAYLIAAAVVLAVGALVWHEVGWRLVHTSAPHADSLPASASARTVLDGYLTALVAGDCAAAASFAAPSFTHSNGELCGSTHVTSATVDSGMSDGITSDGGRFAAHLRYNHADDSMQPGGTLWFYNLQQGPTGRWQLVSGGTGP